MIVQKRNGTQVDFDSQKILTAMTKASKGRINALRLSKMAAVVCDKCSTLNRIVTVEEIQDMVEEVLMGYGEYAVARDYVRYRYEREKLRQGNTTDEKIMTLVEGVNEEAKDENSNKDPMIASVQRDYMAGYVSRDLTERKLLPEDVVKAHREGIIHFHDSDYYLQRIHNCDLVNLEDMLQNGTVISETMIEKPHSFSTACNIATQIIAQVASSQYGGQTISLAHLAPFVEVSRKAIRKEVQEELRFAGATHSRLILQKIVESRLAKEIKKGIQTIQYQVTTLMTTNGQAPFLSLFMYLKEAKSSAEKHDLALLIEEVLKQRIRGVKNEKGVWVTPAFPKLLYVLDDENCSPNTHYYYLTELAAECTAKRMVPDYISEKIMLEEKGDVYPCMGCRSFLTPDRFSDSHKYYGRFNQGVVTINLPDVALSSYGNASTFFDLLEERLELCHKALRLRHERLLGTTSDIAPILWQHGALARLKPGEKIDRLLYGGYSTLSLGYAGLYECVRYMTGDSHTESAGKNFGLKIMRIMNDKCQAWKLAEDIDYSLYGTPLESTTYKFAQCLQRRFGIIPQITDHDYITNSYHVNVREQIDAFTKLALESEFQRLSPGGAISYVEVPDLKGNIPAVLRLLHYIYDHIMYAELNGKSDFCHECDFDGEMQIVEENGHLLWECPNCGNRDQRKMNVARRTCGYIGTQFWNQGRTQEIKDRVMHL